MGVRVERQYLGQARRLIAGAVVACTFAVISAAFAQPGFASEKIVGVSEPNTVGVPATYPSPDGLAARLSDLGADGHRWVLDWQTVERQAPTNGRHSYDFAAADRLYAAGIARGVRPLIVLMGAPPWAWPGEVEASEHGYAIPPGPAHLDDWAAFAAAAARRYPKALGFEVWNEPDAWNFWGRGILPVDPVAYTEVLAAAHDSIKAVNPALRVVGGAIAPYPSTLLGVHLSVQDFVGGMLDAGAASKMDAISIHPYAAGPSVPSAAAYERPVNWLRTTLSQNGVSLPIWITESGVSTTGPASVSEQGQAQALLNLHHWFQSQPDVEALFIHSLFERWTTPSSKEVGFGLIPQGGSAQPKPAYYALQKALGGVAPAASFQVNPGPPPPSPGFNVDASIPKTQDMTRSRSLEINVDCHGFCAVRVHGTLTLRSPSGRPTSSRLPVVNSQITGTTTLQLKLGLNRRALRRAHGRGVRASVVVAAQGPGGAATTTSARATVKR